MYVYVFILLMHSVSVQTIVVCITKCDALLNICVSVLKHLIGYKIYFYTCVHLNKYVSWNIIYYGGHIQNGT